MEGLVNVQLDLHNSIKKSLTNFKKCPKDRITKEYVEARLENLERDWLLFRSNNTKLYEISKPQELASTTYVIQEVYENTEDYYLIYKSSLKSAIQQFGTTECESSFKKESQRSHGLVRLPKITIPTFSGNYSEWTTFRDLFISLVHNNESLDNVQKLHYLKSHLTGEAEQLIRYTPITDANYSECWALIEKRYNNKKYLANCILKRLFGQKRLNVESASGLKELLDNTIDCLNALKNIKIDVSTWDIIIIHIVNFKLDWETRKQWELHISSSGNLDELPTLEQFKHFIESRFRALEFIDTRQSQVHKGNSSNVKPKALLATNRSLMRCEFCSENHKLCFCKKFAKEKIDQRRDFVVKNLICFNCLGSNHSAYNCKKPTTCRICNKRHHSLLHPQENSSTPLAPEGTLESTSTATNAQQAVSCLSVRKVSDHGQVLLATALVNAESKSGTHHLIRALLDQGSQACFITEATVQLLRLKKNLVSGTITGLGGDKAVTSKYMVNINLKSRIDSEFTISVKAYVLKNITSYLPEQKVNALNWIKVNELCLADPQFNIPNKIDILLGANVYSHILEDGIKRSPSGSLIAQNTKLGWILSGTVNDCNDHFPQKTISVSVMHTHLQENDILKKFWEIEEQTNNTKARWTEEEQKCENIYNSTTKRTDEGRYIVKLPFRDSYPNCLGGNSRNIAITKFKALEKRLSKDTDLKRSYTEVINEYLRLGHMRLVRECNKDQAVYLPHHAVIRNDKQTTKVRVVFNASSKNTLGVSLNDTLMVGPKLQPDLRYLILRWRVHQIVLIADIVKMFRQVNIADEDLIFQRIVWRENPENEIKDYELTTVTFGTASAPYLAVKTLNQVSIDEGKDFPVAAPKVANSFYMDDLMTGCSTVKEGVDIYKQMKELLFKAGFVLQKWNSNNEELITIINKTEGIDQKNEIKDKNVEEKDSTTKILGITWNRREDHFRYSVKLPPPSASETKRSIISIIARLYDPLGWIAPTIILAKMFIQKLWLAGVSWDDQIPSELANEWFTYRSELSQLTSITIPRWLYSRTTDVSRELHGFCDASKFAYAAVVFLRVVDSTGRTEVSLLTAKTRVAPIKQVSIPRLELCGAVLLSRLLVEVADVLNIDKNNIKAWSDSTVVLAWLNSHPSRWKTFVANRVSEILTTLDSSQWHHISSKDNPADCASRGVLPKQLINNVLWFSGPSFLKQQNISYRKPTDLQTNLEETVKSHYSAISEDSILQRFSSLTRLLRVIAYCKRFYTRDKNRTTYLSKLEIEQALICCIKKVQKEQFLEEYTQLQNNRYLQNKTSKLKALCPYLDENGIMRISGRLQQSLLCEQTKHPIILPHESHFTNLVISDANNYTESNVNLLKRWQFIQRMLQSFWKRWSQEYLSNLMNRYKWNLHVPEPNIGELVLVKEDDLPPSRWLMGRVVEKHPGSDNVTRVITISTNKSTFKRPTSKVCILPNK